MTNSTPNLATTSSSFYHEAPGKPSPYTNISMDNHFDIDSQLKPLFNSSPMASQRQPANRQVRKLMKLLYLQKINFSYFPVPRITFRLP